MRQSVALCGRLIRSRVECERLPPQRLSDLRWGCGRLVAVRLVSVLCVVSLTALAGLGFDSTPALTATVNQRYRYDLDGVPSVSTDAGVDYTFSLGAHPPEMLVDNVTGELFWFPTVAGDAGVELIVSNRLGDVERQRFTVEVSAGAAPDFVPSPSVVVSLGAPLVLQLSATRGDPPLTWQLAASPMGALLQPERGTLSWSPIAAGTQPFTVSLSNAFGTVTRTFDVVVSAVPQPSPTARLSVTPAEPFPGALVRLSAAGSSAGSPDASLSFLFDFGDGSPSRYGVEDSTQQGYVVPGVYTARVTVENVHLRRDEATARVVVRTDAGLTPPSARIIADPPAGDAPVEVRFSCDCTAGEAELVAWQWEFGDGQSSDLEAPVHVYARPGGYNAKLRVLDALGLEARDSFYIPVWTMDGGRRPPFARARVRPTAVGDAPFAPELVSEFGDPDGVVVQRSWRLPDGREVVDEDPTLQLQTLGVARVELRVTDNDGFVSLDTLELKSTRNGQLPPEIRSRPEGVARVGVPFVYDEDNRAGARNGPVRWSVGLVVDNARVGAPEGLSIDETTGAVTWVPTSAQLGQQEVALVATNAAGSAVQRFQVAVAQAPSGCGCQSADVSLVFAVLVLVARRRRTGGRAGS